MVRRIYVEKKPGLRQEARGLLHELQTVVGVSALEDLRLLNRYDVEGLDEAAFRRAVGTVFSEPQVDDTAAALPAGDCIAFGVEPLPGQFDQRADSAAQCIQLMTQEERPTVRTARIYLLFGPLTAADVDAVKRYVLNPVECREASLDLPERLAAETAVPADVETVTGFTALDRAGLDTLLARLGLAMDLEDLSFLQAYFRDTERRDPTLTEIRVVTPTGPTTAATPRSPPIWTTWRSTIRRSRPPITGIWPPGRRSMGRRKLPSGHRPSWISPPSAPRC